MKTMVVDDEKDVELRLRQYFRKEIKQKKIEFIFTFSGDNALRQLRNMEKPPEIMVIFSDINMQGMNGLELLQTVKRDGSTSRVSMITAYSDQYYEAAMASGADSFHTKPLDFSILKQELLKGEISE